MHLQSLELFGFKSFADKTTFNFHEGITAIVGPNGCGKSNVLDAVRWVLGEQSAKSLRGGEMADVIFNGTDTRKPLGFAEVSLTLTDCVNELGVDWHDVRVTRRIYRDGNSEYFLNKTLCRLKDIQSLFADTGVARSAYSMMEQGKIDLILSSKPEDRRAVFEEAAGITKYKTQKREALRKLEATEANLLRIGDIIKEVKRQIGSLQRQAGKARRYQALLADLKVLDTHHSRKKLDALENELNQCRAELERINDAERDARSRIEQREDDLTGMRRSVEETDAEIADARAESERLLSEISGFRGRIELNRQRSEELNELIAKARAEIATAESKRSKQQVEIEQVTQLVTKTASLLATKRQELAGREERNVQLRNDRTVHDSELQQLIVAASKNETRIAALEDELISITTRTDATRHYLKELEEAIDQSRKTSETAASALNLVQADADAAHSNVQALVREMQIKDEALHTARHALAEVDRRLTAIERSLTEKESRLDILKQLQAEGEGLTQGSQALVRGLENSPRIESAVVGALVSQIEVEPKYIRAIEAILGRGLHTIILRNPDAVPDIMQLLNEKKLGQTALFVPEWCRDHRPSSERPPLPEGAAAWANEVVKSPDSLVLLLRRLLQHIVIFPDLDSALRYKNQSPAQAVATVTGEFISRKGMLFGGSSVAENESLLARKGRISALTAECETLHQNRATVQEERSKAEKLLDDAAHAFEKAQDNHRAADLAHSAATAKIVIRQREADDAGRSLENLLSEKNALDQQIKSAEERVAELTREIETARDTLTAQHDRQQTLERLRSEAVEQEEELVRQISELRLALATEQQRHENLIAQQQPMTARDLELADAIASRRADIETFERRLAAQAEESKQAAASIEEHGRRREQVQASIASLNEKRATHLANLNQAEADLRKARNSLNQLHEDRASHQVRESQLEMTIQGVLDNVERRYHVDLRSFSPDAFAFEKTLRVQLKKTDGGSSAPSLDVMNGGEAAQILASPAERPIHHEVDPANLEKMIAELTERLDNMGPVNLDAVQEYDELEERYRFLETQNNDLTSARRELLDLIAKINSTTQKLFAETFTQVRQNFREMFIELFGGGRADLSLMDENDPLNCGIEITAKPPGKQLQTISLLSGGERTMTAVALL
ncbi:MAG TPA: chromosome segregation protein SMC, partial [Chthoniobacterales bacterium]|nr:chromosome segregation protein SMC [Chthoniobacterales bacterium]